MPHLSPMNWLMMLASSWVFILALSTMLAHEHAPLFPKSHSGLSNTLSPMWQWL